MAARHKFIGGFFELEVSELGNNYHKNGTGLSNGRTCLNLIIKKVRPKNIFIPYYCCDSLLVPLSANKVIITFYEINSKFEPIVLPDLIEGEFFLYINYFGIKTNFVRYLVEKYGDQVIIDNTHNYFETGYNKGSSFNSSRKYFGVPDGAYLYSSLNIKAEYPRNQNFKADHLILRLDQRQEMAFEAFQINELVQSTEPFKISIFTENILCRINYDFVIKKRKSNYNFYHNRLSQFNELSGIDLGVDNTPFCYPFLISNEINFNNFKENGVFIPVFWKEVLTRNQNGFIWEKRISRNILPLPIDHRYNESDLEFVIELIKKIH